MSRDGAASAAWMAARRAEALSQHRAGNLPAALTAYRALLKEAGEDADLLGLLGIAEMQRGDAAEAERVLMRALDVPAEPFVGLRNLNSLIVLLMQAGRRAEAAAVLDRDVPDPAAAARTPEAAELGAIVSLGAALYALGRPQAALDLLVTVTASEALETRRLEVVGLARLALGDAAAAIAPLEQALEGMAGPGLVAQLALAHAAYLTGDKAKTREATQAVAAAHPVCLRAAAPGQAATLLVVNAPIPGVRQPISTLEQMHFRTNFLTQCARVLHDEFRFASVFPVPDLDQRLAALPRPDLVINNLAIAERPLAPEAGARLCAALDRLGVPVVNAPAAVEALTRDAVAARLADCEGVYAPRVARLRRQSPGQSAIAEIPAGFPFPAICRRAAVHSSSGSSLAGHDENAHLARDPLDAADWIGRSRHADFYLVEFVDLARPGGVCRRFRAMVMDDEIMLHSVSYYDHWLVGGWRIGEHAARFYGANPALIEEGAAAIADPARVLGQGPLDALARLRARIPLDIFGIDFDIDAEGRIVVFEVSPAMIFLPAGEIPEHLKPLSMTPEAIVDAFRHFVTRRVGARATA